MADQENDTFMNIGCIGIIILSIITAIVTAWEKSPGLIILVIILAIAAIVGRIYFVNVERANILQKAKDGLDNYVSYDALILEEEVRAKRLENDMKETQIELTYLEQENRNADRYDTSKTKDIERKMKKEELKLMRVKSEYEELKNTIRNMKDEREI